MHTVTAFLYPAACRTEAAEERAALLQLQSNQAGAAEEKAVAQQRQQGAAMHSAMQQLQEAQKLTAWQERRIADLEGSDAYRSIARCIDGLNLFMQITASRLAFEPSDLECFAHARQAERSAGGCAAAGSSNRGGPAC